MKITVVFNLYNAREKIFKRQVLIKRPCKNFKNLISAQGACLDHYGILKYLCLFKKSYAFGFITLQRKNLCHYNFYKNLQTDFQNNLT